MRDTAPSSAAAAGRPGPGSPDAAGDMARQTARRSARTVRDTTFWFDRWRGAAAGVVETAGSTFLLFIAVRHYEAGAFAKAAVATGPALGMLLTPLGVHLAVAVGWTCAGAVRRLCMVSAAGFLLAGLAPGLAVYVAGCGLALTAGALCIPFLTQLYQDNYPEHERGKLFSRAVMIRIMTAAAFSQFAGWALAAFSPRYRWLFLVLAAAQAGAGYCVGRFPSRPLPGERGAHPLHALRYVWADAVFRRTLASWMFMGFGNLMMVALRVEYLANPRYGLALGAGAVAFYTGVLPNLVRLVLNPLWGWLFDRLNFFLLRIAINLGFGIGILAFFVGSGPVGLALGAAVFGAALSGGDLAWSLWVTKVATPDRVADYMAIHTFFTGTRAMCAPFVGFYCAKQLPLGQVAWISIALIAIATVILLPEARWRSRRPAVPLAEEFTE